MPLFHGGSHFQGTVFFAGEGHPKDIGVMGVDEKGEFLNVIKEMFIVRDF